MARKSLVVARPTYILKREDYKEFTKGARVKVRGEGGSWKFLYYCVNADTGSEWIDVFGGDHGHETLRAFSLERVTLIRKGRR